MKNVQRINESQLRAIVAESVKKVLNETTNNVAGTLANGIWKYHRESARKYFKSWEELYSFLGSIEPVLNASKILNGEYKDIETRDAMDNPKTMEPIDNDPFGYKERNPYL